MSNVDKSTASFVRSMCMGRVDEDVIFPFPQMKDEEKDILRTMFQSLEQLFKGREQEFRKWDKDSHMPEEFIEQMKQYGLFSLVIPEEYGGLGLKSSAYSRITQELGKYEASAALTVGAHSSIGMRGLLLFGNDEQKARYMPKLASGEMIAAFCLTEAGSGSDAASITCKAVKEGDHWVLNGSKMWITNGGFAKFFTVFARTDTPEGFMTAFIVEREFAGVSNGHHEDKLGLRASSTTTVSFDNVKIPVANVLGPVGQGFKVAMKILNNGRTGLGGGCVGGMKKLISLSSLQAKERVQFGKPIAEYGLMKQKIGHMVVDTYATESVVALVAGLMDQGYQDYAVEAAISKVFATECLWRTVDEALQIAGGNGFSCEFPYEKILRDCRVNRIFEGTNEILRLFIALTAMNDVGKQLTELSSSLKGIFNDPIKGFGVMSEYALKHASISGFSTGKRGTFTKTHPSIRAQSEIFEDRIRDLAAACDRLLRKHGKNIIGKQFATKRLADIMIDLFVLSAVISRVNAAIESKGVDACVKEVEILTVFSGQVNRRVRGNFGKIDNNDDELIKSLAMHAYENDGYTWDTV